MSFDLGSVVPLSITIHNSAGALANAGSVSATITLPDGTTFPTGVVIPTSTGIYDYDYPTVQAGLHGVRWVATGANAGAFVDIFYVVGADSRQIISLAEGKSHLRMPVDETTHDEDLMSFIWAATGVVELYVGAVVRRTHTQTFDGTGQSRLLLSHIPVLSITSVTEDGTTVDPSGYKINKPAGVLVRVAGSADYAWRPGVQNVDVVYVAARSDVEESWRLAAKIIVKHMWETQRAAAPGPMTQGNEDFDPRYTYSIPRRALELLGEPVGGIA